MLSRLITHIPSLSISQHPFTLFSIPKKAPGELTQHEVSLLTIASRLLDIIRQQAETQPLAAQQEYWKTKVKEELVCCHFLCLFQLLT
jgi:hypothetical protein